MALQFAKYEPKESTLVELGTVASQAGTGGKIKFTPGTIAKFEAGSTKGLSILFIKKNGESVTAPMSNRVSRVVLKALQGGTPKSDVLKVISKLTICEDSTNPDLNIICGPRGEGGEEEELVITSAVTNSKVSYQDLVAF